MDCTDLYEAIKIKALFSGCGIEQMESEETLYYDESGNVKHLILKGGSLNAESDTVFVLGGIQAEDTIFIESLKSKLRKSPTSELKAHKDLNGNFAAILRKDNLRKILELIQEKKWHIHFTAVHVLYYGFVDIIDSIKGTEVCPLELKAELYQVLRKNLAKTVNHFQKYKYPNIKQVHQEKFLDGIISMIDDRINDFASKNLVRPSLILLKKLIDTAKRQYDLPFIQEEESNIWVQPFIQFYRQEIVQFHKKKLIFDEEKQVQKEIEKEDLKIDGKFLTNYSFKDSEKDAMIQVCDYVVSIIRKYIIFLDRAEPDVETDIKSFDETQMRSYIILNSILKESLVYNPFYFNFIISLYTYNKFLKYVNKYGII